MKKTILLLMLLLVSSFAFAESVPVDVVSANSEQMGVGIATRQVTGVTTDRIQVREQINMTGTSAEMAMNQIRSLSENKKDELKVPE